MHNVNSADFHTIQSWFSGIMMCCLVMIQVSKSMIYDTVIVIKETFNDKKYKFAKKKPEFMQKYHMYKFFIRLLMNCICI